VLLKNQLKKIKIFKNIVGLKNKHRFTWAEKPIKNILYYK